MAYFTGKNSRYILTDKVAKLLKTAFDHPIKFIDKSVFKKCHASSSRYRQQGLSYNDSLHLPKLTGKISKNMFAIWVN